MARPRRQSDPNQWPVPCCRCGEHHQIAAKWPDGGVCGYCYQQAKRTTGICASMYTNSLPFITENDAWRTYGEFEEAVYAAL